MREIKFIKNKNDTIIQQIEDKYITSEVYFSDKGSMILDFKPPYNKFEKECE